MSYIKDYAAMSGEEKIRKALKDTLSYVGPTTYKKLVRGWRKNKEEPNAENCFRFAVSFAGIQGYPVTAIMERY